MKLESLTVNEATQVPVPVSVNRAEVEGWEALFRAYKTAMDDLIPMKRVENPYHADTSEHNAWNKGYHNADKQAKDFEAIEGVDTEDEEMERQHNWLKVSKEHYAKVEHVEKQLKAEGKDVYMVHSLTKRPPYKTELLYRWKDGVKDKIVVSGE